MSDPPFDALRAYKRDLTGEGLTQADVDGFNAIFATWKPAGKNPTALSDGAKFFDVVRTTFGGLNQGQVEGIEGLLQAFGAAQWPIAYAAYGLATAWHETNQTMKPVREAYWLSEDWRKAHLTKYYPYYGRGFVQLTWQKNYKRADDELGLGGKLVANIDLALDPGIAAPVMVRGMEEGWFTGKALKDYLLLGVGAQYDDYKEARRIINGQDQADKIAKEATQFEASLIAGGWR